MQRSEVMVIETTGVGLVIYKAPHTQAIPRERKKGNVVMMGFAVQDDG